MVRRPNLLMLLSKRGNCTRRRDANLIDVKNLAIARVICTAAQVEQASEWAADTSEVRGIGFPRADPYRATRVKYPEQEDRR